MFGLIGLAVFAFGVYLWRSRRVPAGALRFSGTVVDVRERRSTTNTRRIRFRPVLAYQHPITGRRELMEPMGFTNRKPQMGEPVPIAYDRARDRVLIVRTRRQHFAIPAIGAAMIAIQVASWAS
jgi:hypothetical protein